MYYFYKGIFLYYSFSDLSARFLSDSREGRYERGILPGEENRVPQPSSAIDIYAFCVLITEIFGKQVEGS